MHVEIVEGTFTTATGGGVTGYLPAVGALTGKLAAVQYIPGATGVALASTADLTITLDRTGESIWAESNITAGKTVRPKRAGASASGVTATGAALTEDVFLKDDRIKVAIAQGGNTKQATFRVTVV